MIRLSLNQILNIHYVMTSRTGGCPGVRSMELLDSGVMSAFGEFGGEEFYPTTLEKCVRICYNIISNHPFIDGNKRTGVIIMMMLLKLNNISFNFTNQDIIHIGLNTANNTLDYNSLLDYVKSKVY